MIDLLADCDFLDLTPELLDRSSNFLCGDQDLDDFFRDEAQKFRQSLMGKTYCFASRDPNREILVAFTLANDSVRIYDLPRSRKTAMQRKTHKRIRRYPGVLIGRLGVNTKFQSQGIGAQALKFIKLWFSEPNNKTGCRYIIVEALNCEKVLGFYLRNGFNFMFTSENQERSYDEIDTEKILETRLMMFDLLDLQ